MTESKGVNVSKHPPSSYFSEFSEYRSGGRIIAGESEYARTHNTACQINVRRNPLCTCKMSNGKHRNHKPRFFNTAPKHIYAYHGLKTNSINGIGVSSVKAMNRRRTQRVYLPDTEDRGIGSADLSSFFISDRRSLDETESYYGSKRTSSKCVGGALEEPTGIVDEKLSPIIKCCNADTGSEMLLSSDHNGKEVSIAEDKHLITATPQAQTSSETYDDLGHDDTDDLGPMPKVVSRVIESRSKAYLAKKETDAKFSSDSLIQHIHNLELSSINKLSQGLVDPMENKLEREYRHMFESKSKHQDLESPSQQEQNKSVHKSTSLLKRRFEALRRGHKRDETKNEVVVKPSSKTPSYKDVSVTSDPPSLVARSYVSKAYSPPNLDPPREMDTVKHESYPVTGDDDSSYNQGVLSMFRLWSKKINLDESQNTSEIPPPKVQNGSKTKEKIDSKEEKKSQGKKFFFFKRKDKSITQSDQTPCKNNKKSVTANRCEIKDTLVHKAPKKSKARRYTKVPSKQKVIAAKYEEVLCKAWLSKFIMNNSDSNESAKIRWNNNTYTTSSSTVFELMDNVYKDVGLARRSKSAASTFRNNRSTTKRVNFLQQNIEAWMIPKTITHSPMMSPINKKKPSSKDISEKIAVAISKKKWAIDTARTFSRRIELVLHSNNFSKLNNKESSDFLKIDIPKGFFSDSMNGEEHRCRISDEEVYKIVEYETLKSKSDIRKVANRSHDRAFNEISVTISVKDSKNNESKVLETVIKKRPTQRDVVIQGSRVSFPKRCDVIGVGIITQMKPILKMQENYSQEVSGPKVFTPKKKCDFAESYLQDYYRQWIPLGIDLYSPCRSNAKIKCSSEKNCVLPLRPEAGSKSCPNIFEEYRKSGTTSFSEDESDNLSCSPFMHEANSNIFFTKVKKDKQSNNTNMRVLPKDSTEVTKKRQTYACSNKAKWRDESDDDDRCCDSPEMGSRRSSCADKKPTKKKCNSKRVLLQDYDVYDPNKCQEVTGIIAYKGATCKTNRSDVKCSKHSKLDLKPCEMQLHEPGSGGLTTPTKKFSPCHQKPQSVATSPCKRSDECCVPINIPPCLKNAICKDLPPESPPPRNCQEIAVPKKQTCPSQDFIKRPSEFSTPSQQAPCSARASGAPMVTRQDSSPCMRRREGPQMFPPPPPPNLKFKAMENADRSCAVSGSTVDTTSFTKLKGKEKKKKKKKENQATCDCPPSSDSNQGLDRSPSPDSDQAYPWPTNNKVSVPPSPQYSKPEHPRAHKSSHSHDPEKECKPDCANRRKLYKYVDSGHCHQPISPSHDGSYSPSHNQPPCPALGPPHCPSMPPQYPPNSARCPLHSIGYPPTPEPYPPNPAPYPSTALGQPQPPPPQCPHYPPNNLPTAQPAPDSNFHQGSPLPAPPSANTHTCPDCLSNSRPPKYPSNHKVYPSTTIYPAPHGCSNLPCNPPLQQMTPKPIQNHHRSENHCPLQNKCPSQNQCPLQNQCSLQNQYPPQNQYQSMIQCPLQSQSPPQNQCPHQNQCPLQNQCPPQNQCPQVEAQKQCRNYKSKLAGFFQKKKKNCDEEHVAAVWCNQPNHQDIKDDATQLLISVTKGSNTDRNMTIRCPRDTPSIKGNKAQHSTHVATVLGSTYKASNICRVSTPADFDAEDKASASIQSIANVVELDFTIKVTQGDKLARIVFKKDGDTQKVKTTNVIKTCSKEIYVVHPTETPEQIEIKDPNDINLHVVIKNFKRTDKNVPSDKDLSALQKNINFTKTISKKFHTVSTGYSEISRCNLNQTGTETSNIFSVHRATWDLTCSDDKSKRSKASRESSSPDQEKNVMASQSVATVTETPNKSKTALDEKSSKSEQVIESKTDVDREFDQNTGDSDHECTEETISNSEVMSSDTSRPFLLNIPPWLGRNKTERIRMLKIAIDRASKLEHEDKDKLVKITNMLNAVVNSDSTDIVNMNVTCKDLPKTPLSSGYNDSHSTNNICEKSVALKKHKHDAKSDITSKQSGDSKKSAESLIGCSDLGCLCAVKNKPKELGQGGWCCCRKPLKINIETNCDIRTSEDVFVLDYKSPTVADQETQRSRFMFSRANSFNFSIHNYACESILLRNSVIGKGLTNKLDSDEIDELPMTSSSDESPEEVGDSKTVLKISDENKLILASLAPTKNLNLTKGARNKDKPVPNSGIIAASEVLQCYEAKKAVLEIYAEKTMSDGKEHIVAKLPKFTRKKEREICEYGEITVKRLQKEALCR